MSNKTKKASPDNNDKKKKKKKKATGGQLAQPGQAPQGGKSTFGSRDSVFTPNIKKKAPLKRALKGNQGNLPPEIQAAIKKAPPTKRYCNGKSKPFKRKKY